MLLTLTFGALTAGVVCLLALALGRLALNLATYAQELDAQAAVMLQLAAKIEALERLTYGLPLAQGEKKSAR